MRASADEIRSAFRALALRWHPDVNPGNETLAAGMFCRIVEAYTVLSDSARRCAYDDLLSKSESSFNNRHDKAVRQAERQGQQLGKKLSEMRFGEFCTYLFDMLQRGLTKVVDAYDRFTDYMSAMEEQKRLVDKTMDEIASRRRGELRLGAILLGLGFSLALVIAAALIYKSVCCSYYALLLIVPMVIISMGGLQLEDVTDEQQAAEKKIRASGPSLRDSFKGFWK